jgi:hypothetical protein
MPVLFRKSSVFKKQIILWPVWETFGSTARSLVTHSVPRRDLLVNWQIPASTPYKQSCKTSKWNNWNYIHFTVKCFRNERCVLQLFVIRSLGRCWQEVWLHSNTHLAIIASWCHLSHNLRNSFNRTPVTTHCLVVLKLATTLRTPVTTLYVLIISYDVGPN